VSQPQGLAAYIAVTAAYWAFMLTDGALRMLVLLHFHTLGFSPVQLAYLFVLYEIAGVVTNLSAGWIAARFGLTSTLYAGLSLQVAALVALTQLDPAWSIAASVAGMAVLLAAILLAVVWRMPPGLPTGRKDAKFREVFSKNRDINWLSFARLFLFGARDVWFVVGIPIYFYAVLSDGSEAGNRAAFFLIGSFMAIWIILYGAVQASAPKLMRAADRPTGQLIRAASRWAMALVAVPALLAGLTALVDAPAPWLTATVVAGLLLFGAIFAVNSALHSYLILALTNDDRVTMDVGFYYMSNAAGRLLGTVLSGASYQIGGLPMCLATAAGLLIISAFGAARLGQR
jgi:hypothetical protein